ncbi:hypothetical protein [Parvibaculum sp.]|uniref:hypothetical protein n=1 Tax=Parvibaculum sp. TaxID=2024848 RepID=UPI002730CE0E|nr:hypothetical protein [Parvibaculum sp.]MDP1627548.1 hypothetical protein [Parvibaculum sp.]MDP2148727.1 hypothetical protein [Parvibaculum sp.]MDP3327921.1 hypothetical protein [Parvibaculum sp.]
MMQKEITLERLAGIVGAYGASPSRWPEDERAAAEALLAASAEARALVADAARFDALLDMAPAEAPSEALVARLMAARPRAVPPVSAPATAPRKTFLRGFVEAVWPYGSPAFPAGALAASIMLGVTLGSTLDISLPTTSTMTAATPDAATGDELISLALADTAWPEEWMQ